MLPPTFSRSFVRSLLSATLLSSSMRSRREVVLQVRFLYFFAAAYARSWPVFTFLFAGKMWAHEHWGLSQAPDAVTFSKKMQAAGYYHNLDLRPGESYRNFNTW